MTAVKREALLARIAAADQIPSLPNVIAPLIQYLQQPMESLNVGDVVRLISQDEAMTVQCLHLANSPLFGRWQAVETVRGAVVSLGMRRMREVATSCCLLSLTPKDFPFDATVFWEHAFGVALTARYLARAVAFPDPDKAYLAGLLHDFGVVMGLWLAPKEYVAVLRDAKTQHRPLAEAEMDAFGLTHSEIGRILGERWHMPADLVQVIACHHNVARASQENGLVAVVSIADLLCRMEMIGYGYPEDREVDFRQEASFAVLLADCPNLAKLDWERFTLEMESYMAEVKQLVAQVYRRS